MTEGERRKLVYGASILALVFLFWPYTRIVNPEKSIILHLMVRFPFVLLGDWNLRLEKVDFNLIDDILAIAINPGFIAGAIVGRFLVKDWSSSVKALFPVIGASVGVFLIGFVLTRIAPGGGDLAGLWVIAPMATVVFWPFAWLGALAGWKGGEFYDSQKGNLG